jgi:uncharacterized protein (TIGR02145 family)
MSKTVSKFALTAGLVLALAFTFSCSGDDEGGGDPSSSSGRNSGGVSSSSGGGQGCEVSGSVPSCGEYDPATQYCSNGTIKDYELFVPYEGQTYKAVVIGEQTWFAENLNYEVEGSKCYKNDPANCTKYGRLYSWATALTVCPSGWHLPSDAEWTTLTNYVGSSSTAGSKLKATSGWNNRIDGCSGNGTDEYGFSALPGGFGGNSYGSFDGFDGIGGVGDGGYWWSATESSANNAYYRDMYYDLSSVYRYYTDKPNLRSVRCGKD